ncbi:MAG: hypothetical protein GXN92_00625, partial [Candidatus Micrarchaeota archaeon]|nr:hypothetical protein [Candidatus Micrarchaeota archaeon]
GIAGIYVNYSNVLLNNVTIRDQLYAGIVAEDSEVEIYDSNLSANARGTYLIEGISYFYNSTFCSNTVQDIVITDVDSLNHIGEENQCDSPGGSGYYDDLNAYGCTYLCPTGTNTPPQNQILSPLPNQTYYGANLTITFNITDRDNLFPNNTLRVYMDLSGNSPIYFNDSYVVGTLATFVYSNPDALPGLYYLTIYARDRYKAESLDVIAFYWYPGGCYCGSCEECSAMIASDSCEQVVINQSFQATAEICFENLTKPLIGQGYEIIGSGGIGIQALSGAYIFNLTLTGFDTAINGTGNVTVENVRITHNTQGILMNDSLFLTAYNNYVCYNNLDVALEEPSYISENNTCQRTYNFQCRRKCVVEDDKEEEPLNETIVEESFNQTEILQEEEPVGEVLSPSPPPVEENITPVEEPMVEPKIPPQEEEPEIVEQPPEPQPTPAPPEEKIQSQHTPVSPAQPATFPYYYVLPVIIGLLLLARIARYRILETSHGYILYVTNLLNQPLANKEIQVDGKKMRLDKDGKVVLPSRPRKLRMAYRILLKK